MATTAAQLTRLRLRDADGVEWRFVSLAPDQPHIRAVVAWVSDGTRFQLATGTRLIGQPVAVETQDALFAVAADDSPWTPLF